MNQVMKCANNRLEDMFLAPLSLGPREFFQDFFGPDLFTVERPAGFSPAIDVSETDSTYQVNVELPGVDPKELEISLENNELTVRGEKKESQEPKEANFHRVERHYGSFQRTFCLPAEVNAEQIKADHRNGVLTITIPKAEKARPKKISVSTS